MRPRGVWHVATTTQANPDYSGLSWIGLFTLVFLVIGFLRWPIKEPQFLIVLETV